MGTGRGGPCGNGAQDGGRWHATRRHLPRPNISSQQKGVQKNADGAVDVYFSPKVPVGKESNWVQTVTGKLWNTILHLYGLPEP